MLCACDNMAAQLRPTPLEEPKTTSSNEIMSGAPNIAQGGALATGNTLPFPLTREVLTRGAERYAIACMPCHGALGDGGGPVSMRGYAWVPSFHTPEMRRETLSHYVNVITYGFGAMPAHAAQVAPDDRFRIAAYIRAMQLSQYATLDDVPPPQRAQLAHAKPGQP